MDEIKAKPLFKVFNMDRIRSFVFQPELGTDEEGEELNSKLTQQFPPRSVIHRSFLFQGKLEIKPFFLLKSISLQSEPITNFLRLLSSMVTNQALWEKNPGHH